MRNVKTLLSDMTTKLFLNDNNQSENKTIRGNHYHTNLELDNNSYYI